MSTARVLTVILEKGLPYHYILVDIAMGEQKSEQYRKLQPFGKVPVLNDDGFIMFESRAICKYLDRKYPSGVALTPQDTDGVGAHGRFEQACSVEQSYFAAAAETLGTELVIRPLKGLGTPDEARVAQADADLEKVFAVYEEILSKQNYIAGDKLTLADLFHLPNGAALKAGRWNTLFEKHPHVDKWFAALQGRRSWIEAAKITGAAP